MPCDKGDLIDNVHVVHLLITFLSCHTRTLSRYAEPSTPWIPTMGINASNRMNVYLLAPQARQAPERSARGSLPIRAPSA